ncbi:transposase [Pseudomonas sp. IT-P294]
MCLLVSLEEGHRDALQPNANFLKKTQSTHVPVGASLLAIAVGHPTFLVNVISIASKLAPTGLHR